MTINTKYSLYQKVYFIFDYEIITTRISGIEIQHYIDSDGTIITYIEYTTDFEYLNGAINTQFTFKEDKDSHIYIKLDDIPNIENYEKTL